MSEAALRDVIILYIEDELFGRTIFNYIRERYGPSSEWIRSDESLDRLLAEGFIPSLVIHDCQILELDDDEIASEKAAKAAYAKCVKRRFPIVVLSGKDEMAHHSPYTDHPPLDWLTKPVDKEKIDLAVERYLAFRQR